MLKEVADQDVLTESFLSTGRVDHITMVMAMHPAYLSCFLRTQHALLEMDGPLPHDWRHYIAVMVREGRFFSLKTLGRTFLYVSSKRVERHSPVCSVVQSVNCFNLP